MFATLSTRKNWHHILIIWKKNQCFFRYYDKNSMLSTNNELVQVVRNLDPLSKWSNVGSLTLTYEKNSVEREKSRLLLQRFPTLTLDDVYEKTFVERCQTYKWISVISKILYNSYSWVACGKYNFICQKIYIKIMYKKYSNP